MKYTVPNQSFFFRNPVITYSDFIACSLVPVPRLSVPRCANLLKEKFSVFENNTVKLSDSDPLWWSNNFNIKLTVANMKWPWTVNELTFWKPSNLQLACAGNGQNLWAHMPVCLHLVCRPCMALNYRCIDQISAGDRYTPRLDPLNFKLRVYMRLSPLRYKHPQQCRSATLTPTTPILMQPAVCRQPLARSLLTPLFPMISSFSNSAFPSKSPTAFLWRIIQAATAYRTPGPLLLRLSLDGHSRSMGMNFI